MYFQNGISTELAPPRPQRGSYETGGKRVFDVVLVCLSLPVILPVLLLIWCCLRASGSAPVFVQERVGEHGRVFRCYKFRTMFADAEDRLADLLAASPDLAREWAHHQKLVNDPRVTPLGRLLRKTSLDELPQLFNVLLGDMSLVGPRPFLPEQETFYRAEGGRSYYTVKPGITGPWQVSVRSTSAFAERVKFDTNYARSIRLKTDLWLLIKTVQVVIGARGV